MVSSVEVPPILLFTYPGSFYAKKIEFVLAYKKIPYHSCAVSNLANERHYLQKLGIWHRRIPICAIGCDLYFDTNLIAEKIEELYPAEPLRAAGIPGVMSASFADNEIFTRLVKTAPLYRRGEAFMADRIVTFPYLGDDVKRRTEVAKEQSHLRAHFAKMEYILARQDYLFDNKISILDLTIVALAEFLLPYLLGSWDDEDEEQSGTLANLFRYLQDVNAVLETRAEEYRHNVKRLQESDIAKFFSACPLSKLPDIPATNSDVLLRSDENIALQSHVRLRTCDAHAITQTGTLVYLDAELAAVEVQVDNSPLLRCWVPRSTYDIEAAMP